MHKSPLNDHIPSVHEGMKPYSCADGTAKFEKKSKLNEHIVSAHEGKKSLPSVPLTENLLELGKDQCGHHTVCEMAKFLSVNKQTLGNMIKQD